MLAGAPMTTGWLGWKSRPSARGESFSFESTLAGKSWLPILTEATNQGYSISIYFLFLSKVEKNLQRIKKRVQLGGHLVPKETVLRRYPRCFIYFWNLFRPIASDWYVLDNSGSAPRLTMAKSDFDKMTSDERPEYAARFLKGKNIGRQRPRASVLAKSTKR